MHPSHFLTCSSLSLILSSFQFGHLDLPEVRAWKPRKVVGVDVGEQEVYGIDPFTHNMLLDTMPDMPPAESEEDRHAFIEDVSGGGVGEREA